MAKTLAAAAVISNTSQAAGATTRGRFDASAVDGGILTFALTNGGTPPTVQATLRVLIAHKQASMPAAAAEGVADTDWKQVYEIGGGVAASAKSRGVYRFGPEVAYIEVESTGNTGQPVNVEAHVTTFTY